MALRGIASSRWAASEGASLFPGRDEDRRRTSMQLCALLKACAKRHVAAVYPERHRHPGTVLWGLITARTNRAGSWHCRIPLASMQRASYYAYRVEGSTANGRFEWHWFDRDKILLDPYARSVSPATRGRSEGRRRSIVQAESY